MSAVPDAHLGLKIEARSKAQSTTNLLTRFLKLFSSVRFGVVLLILLALASTLGMVIMQQNVDGFDRYYAALTPSQRLLFGKLGFFNIYHSWYFNVLIQVLSLNIILSSIERFPTAWRFIRNKQLVVSPVWLGKQDQSASFELIGDDQDAVATRIAAAFRSARFKPTVTIQGDQTTVYGERGAWNRLGAYAVHVGLLTIFLGGLLTAQFSRDGQMRLQPGAKTSEISGVNIELDKVKAVPIQLPFSVECTDIQQKLINRDGSITADNTIDWLTRIKIKDENGERSALVHLNTPYDYRGYRFFQASFIAVGKARTIKLRLVPDAGSAKPIEVELERDGATTLADGTKIAFRDFKADFRLGAEEEENAEYANPAAILDVTTPAGEKKTVYAFAKALPESAPVGSAFGGYKYNLADFEKVPLEHILAVQKDPGRIPFYVGSALLILTLCAVFFFSHQRVWALVEKREDGKIGVLLGGNTNRNKLGFGDRFINLVNVINGSNMKGRS